MKAFDRIPDQEGESGWPEGDARGSAQAIECDTGPVAAQRYRLRPYTSMWL